MDDKQRVFIEKRILPQLDVFLEPASGEEIAARVTALLAHFFVPSMQDGLRKAMFKDWIKALDALPLWAIRHACEAWLRSENRKPTPAAIRRLALEALDGADVQRDRLRAVIALPPPANALVTALSEKLPPVMVALWIAPLGLILENETALVRCPSSLHRDWIKAKCGDLIAQALPGRIVLILAPGEMPSKPLSLEERRAYVPKVRKMREENKSY